VAYIVDSQAPASAATLRSFLALSLPQAIIPARFVRLTALPLAPSGKVNRAALPRPEIRQRPPLAARNETERKVLALFRDVLGAAEIGVNDDFFEWGGDSLKAFDLMTRIFEATGVKLPGATLLNAPTVEDLAREVAQGVRGEVMTVWLRNSGDLPPLVCLPGLAADPLWMFPLIAALDPRQPLLGLSFVGLKPPITIKGAAARGLEELRAVQPRGPYFLLGHSLGGVLAFEMARDLIASGEEVAFLGLLDTFVPGSPRPGATPRTPSLVGTLRTWRGRIVPETRKGVRRVLTFLGVLKKRPVELFLPGFRAAIQNHRILPGDLAVTLFRASERSTSSDLASDWAPLARGGVEVIDVPGHHLNLLTGGRANELSVRIAEAVARSTRSLSAA
jgi:thioesterase domain-containing protein/acyl carrier protein